MEFRDFNKGTIADILKKYDFSHIKVRPANSLFVVAPLWKKLEDDRCPFCGRKLSISPTKNIVRCISPHCVSERKFIIRKDRYYEIKTEIIKKA